MEPYPLTFEPILKEKVWGGQSLANFGKQIPNDKPIGESWELADLPDEVGGGISIIANGLLAGTSLQDAIQENPHFMGKTQCINGCFPLLMKYLDATDNLSVQVHPDDAYVQTHPEAHLKSEAWIILDAAEGSCIYVGLTSGTTETQLRAAISSDTVPDYIRSIEVHRGECYYLPSGTCHALGAGVVVAEVQTPSDTTFRVWDWGRTGRETHVDQAMACIDFYAAPLTFPTPTSLESSDFVTTHFVDTPYFSIDCVEATHDTTLELHTDVSPQVLMVIEGHASIEHDNSINVPTGTTVLLPAGLSATLSMPKGTAVLQFDLPTQKTIA